MAKLEFSGTLIHVGKPEKKSDKFTLQEIVVEEKGDKYPVKVSMQLAQKQLEHAAKLKVGQSIEVKANVSAREYNGKYYNSIEAWFLKQEAGSNKGGMQPNNEFDNDQDDTLPF